MRHAYVGTPRRHITIEATIRDMRKRTKERAARIQGDWALWWADVVGHHVRVCARAGWYRCVTRIGPRREQQERHGRCRQPRDEFRVLDQISHEGQSEVTPCGIACDNDVIWSEANGPCQIDVACQGVEQGGRAWVRGLVGLVFGYPILDGEHVMNVGAVLEQTPSNVRGNIVGIGRKSDVSTSVQ